MPTRSAEMFASGTSAKIHTRDRSAIVSSVVDGSTDVPTVMPRLTTTPLLGATTVTSRFGSPVCSIASISAGVIPSTVSRVRPLATTTLVIPMSVVVFRAAKYSVWDESSSCEKMRASGSPARTISPVVLISSCSIHPDTRVCTCEILDSSGTTVATARTDCVIASRRTTSSLISSAWSIESVTPTVTRSRVGADPVVGATPVTRPATIVCSRGENGHASRALCTHITPMNTAAVTTAERMGAANRWSLEVKIIG